MICHVKGGTRGAGFRVRGAEEAFGPKRDEVTAEGGSYVGSYMICPTHQTLFWSTRFEWAGHVARPLETINANKFLVGKTERRPRRGWTCSIKWTLKV